MATTMFSGSSKSTLTRLLKAKGNLRNFPQCFCRSESKVSLEDHRANAESSEGDREDDFFGLMRGDGVVEVAKSDKIIDPFRKYDRLMRGPEQQEKLFLTSFGSIRFDSDNRPGDDERWTSRPKLNERINEIKENYENSSISRRDDEENVRRRRKKETTEKINTQPENYVDDLYFKQMMDVGQHQNENTRNETKQSQTTPRNTTQSDEGGNYIDQMYFGNVESYEKSDPRPNDDDEQKISHSLNVTDVNYIDEIYFSQKSEVITKQNLEKETNKDVTKVIKSKSKQTYENEERRISQFAHEFDETELSRKKTVKVMKSQNPERKPDEELGKNTLEVVKKCTAVNSETALDYVEKVSQRKRMEKIETGQVEQQVVDIFKEPEYVVLKMLRDSIIYNDNDILAINKPYGLPCQDGPKCHHNLLKFLPDLAASCNIETLYPIHRLDANTTGVLLLAKTETMATYLKSLFKQRKIYKTYYAITRKVPDPPEGIINIPIAEGTILGRRRMVLKPDYNEVTKTVVKKSSIPSQEAKTEYKVISQCENTSLVSLVARTGVTHQIRVHLGFGLGCPVLGDHKYTSMTKLAPQKLPDDMLRKLNIRQSKVRDLPLHLHARTIGIPEIIDGKNIFIRAALPTHFSWALKKLKLGSKRNVTT